MDILDDSELPIGMKYPEALRRLVQRGVVHLEPWFIFRADEAKQRMSSLGTRYPTRTLVPFARREDNDDVACFAPEYPGKVVIVHDFASPGSEDREVLDNFYSWLRKAVEDMIEFDSLED